MAESTQQAPWLPSTTLTGTEVLQVASEGGAGPAVKTTTQGIADLATTEMNEVRLSVYNGTGGALAAGTLLYVNGWNAANSVNTVAKADADVQAAWATFVTRASLADATVGWVYKTATLTAQATDGTTIGDPYYLSATAGEGTKTVPTGASRVQVVGRITTVHASTGTVDVDLLAEAPFLVAPVISGGTGLATMGAVGAIPTGGTAGTGTMVALADVAVGAVLASGGVGVIPQYLATAVPLTGISPQLVLGAVVASSSGAVDFKGLTSGTTRLTVPAAAGAVTVTLPTVATTGPTVQATAGQALSSDASGVQSYASFAGLGTLVGTQTLTSGTDATYTPTAGATVALFHLVGAGGGGGGADFTAADFGCGGGGGGGGYAIKRYTTLTGITYTIGALGTGGTVGNNAGLAGGDTTSTQSATTVTAKGGSGGASTASGVTVVFVAGGAGGTISTNGDLNAGGAAGTFGARSATIGAGGAGGSSRFGGGATGAVGDAAGNNAVAFGAGGSGGAASTTDRAGGNGSNGVIFVEEFR